MQKTICVVTGSRAEYGLVYPLLLKIKASSALSLQLLVTGSHLSPQHGMTYREIVEDGFEIDAKVEMQVSSDTRVGTAKSMGLAMIGMADAMESLKSDLVVVTGDRFETFAGASCANVMSIPIAHLHGGELTFGAMDEYFRHAITKLSSLHFTATEEYRKRVIQMGEHPDTVFNVGGLGVDNTVNTKFLSRKSLEKSLNISLEEQIYMVTYHPETGSGNTADEDVEELLSALETLDDTSTILVSSPNADPDNHRIFERLAQFVNNGRNRYMFNSLGRQRYLSLMRESTVLIGNSSSGIIEAPSFRVPTINIGDRQRGRVRAESVIDVEANRRDILDAIKSIGTPDIARRVANAVNPYGNGGASSLIAETLESVDFDTSSVKQFYDVAFTGDNC